MNMIKIFNTNKNEKNKILIDEKFPKNIIVKIFSPYLNIFLNSKYLLLPILKYKYAYELEKKLTKFQKFNPLFGRIKVTYKNKICRDGKIRKLKYKDEINESCINFNEYNNDTFLKDHLSYKYIEYENINNNFALIYNQNIHYSESEDDDEDDSVS